MYLNEFYGKSGTEKIFFGKFDFSEPVEPRSEHQNRAYKVAPKRNFLSESPQNRSK